MLSRDRLNGSGLCRCGWPSISEMLSPLLDQIVFARCCGWPSISEMLSPVDGAAAAVDGCGWPSISEMLSRSGYTCPLDNICGWPSISEMLRSEERRLGKECDGKGRSRWSPKY